MYIWFNFFFLGYACSQKYNPFVHSEIKEKQTFSPATFELRLKLRFFVINEIELIKVLTEISTVMQT